MPAPSEIRTLDPIDAAILDGLHRPDQHRHQRSRGRRRAARSRLRIAYYLGAAQGRRVAR